MKHAMTSAGKRWDAYDAYIFDIDDTLLHCHDAVHYFAFCAALESLAGRALNLDGVAVHGSTDVAILRDALHRGGIAEEMWRPRLAESCKTMCNFVALHDNEFVISVLPGVRGVLEQLREREAVAGLGTGNLEGIAWTKLRRCALEGHFKFGGFSDDCEYRPEIIRRALDAALALAGTGASVCVIGDTPADVDAARRNGLDVIAVATGIYSRAELAAHSPTLCVASLEELLPAE